MSKFSSIIVTGNGSVGGTLSVVGAVTLSSTLAMVGNFAVNGDKFTVAGSSGNTAIKGTLGVDGAVTLGSTLGLVGNFAIATNKFTVTAANGNTAIAGTLNVAGAGVFATTLAVTGDFAVATDKFAVVAASGNTSVGGTFLAVGAATLSSSLALAGNFAVATNKFTVDSGTGNTLVAGTFSATGAGAFASTLSAAGDFAVNTDKFTVTASNGNASVLGSLTVGGSLILPVQTANRVWAGPTTGAAAAPTFRALVAADIPALDAAKVTSGAFDAARIPSLDASKIATGTIDPARIPIINSAVQVVSASATIAGLSAGEQLLVVLGCTLTLTDGTRWTYIGTGSKTDAANYIQIGDITPEWSVIANKPTTLAGFGITAGVLTTLSVTSTSAFGGDIAVNTNKFTIAAVSGNTAIAGTLDVTGVTSLGSLHTSGAISTSTSLTAVTFITAGTTLTVAGATTLSSTLALTGAATLASTLNVAGVTTLAAVTATTFNKVTLTTPATGVTITITDGKTFACTNTLTLAGTDGSTLNVGAGGTLGTAAYVDVAALVAQANNLSDLASVKVARQNLGVPFSRHVEGNTSVTVSGDSGQIINVTVAGADVPVVLPDPAVVGEGWTCLIRRENDDLTGVVLTDPLIGTDQPKLAYGGDAMLVWSDGTNFFALVFTGTVDIGSTRYDKHLQIFGTGVQVGSLKVDTTNGTPYTKIKSGSATLVAGEIVVSEPISATGTVVFTATSAPAGYLYEKKADRVANTSFKIKSTSGADTCTVDWTVFEHA